MFHRRVAAGGNEINVESHDAALGKDTLPLLTAVSYTFSDSRQTCTRIVNVRSTYPPRLLIRFDSAGCSAMPTSTLILVSIAVKFADRLRVEPTPNQKFHAMRFGRPHTAEISHVLFYLSFIGLLIRATLKGQRKSESDRR